MLQNSVSFNLISHYCTNNIVRVLQKCLQNNLTYRFFQTRVDKDGHSYSASLEIKNVTIEDAGKYKVTAKNELGESNATISLNFDSKYKRQLWLSLVNLSVSLRWWACINMYVSLVLPRFARLSLHRPTFILGHFLYTIYSTLTVPFILIQYSIFYHQVRFGLEFSYITVQIYFEFGLN